MAKASWPRSEQATFPSKHTSSGQKRILEIPPHNRSISLDPIAHFLKFLRSYGCGKIYCIMRLQDFLLRPEVLCPYGLGFPPGAPLPGGAGLGSLGSMALRFLGSEGNVYKNFQGKAFYQGNLCYHGVAERIRLQEQKILGDFSRARGRKTVF